MRAERDDAVGRGGRHRGAQRVAGAGEGLASRRRSSRLDERTRTRRLAGGARRRRDVVPDQGGDLGAAQPGAERQRHDRGVAPSAGRRCRGCLPPPAAPLGQRGRPHQLDRGGVVQSGGLAERCRGDRGVLAGRCRAACRPPAASSSGPPARPSARRPRSPPPRSAPSRACGSWPGRPSRRPPAPRRPRAGRRRRAARTRRRSGSTATRRSPACCRPSAEAAAGRTCPGARGC